MFNPEVVGFSAGALTTIAFLPQALKVYRTNQTDDLSLRTFIIFLIGIILWTTYGFLINSKCLIVTNLFQMILIIYIIYKITLHSKPYNQ